ncbi:MAG: hypothetical protein ACR2I8_02175 [Steroidobacteraceae bacterium]
MQPTPSNRLLLLAGLAVALAGCSTNKTCRVDNPEYLQAQDRPRLQLPEGVTGSERLQTAALVIPPAAPNPDKLEPAPRCLDAPPAYARRAPGSPAPATEAAPKQAD